jgi:hypothetical protein
MARNEEIVTSMEPKSGKTSEDGPVTIIGKGFDNRIIVHFGENDAEIKERTGQESIIAVPPAHAAGKVCVFVIDKKSGRLFTVPDVYEYIDDPGPGQNQTKDELLQRSEGGIK